MERNFQGRKLIRQKVVSSVDENNNHEWAIHR